MVDVARLNDTRVARSSGRAETGDRRSPARRYAELNYELTFVLERRPRRAASNNGSKQCAARNSDEAEVCPHGSRPLGWETRRPPGVSTVSLIQPYYATIDFALTLWRRSV